MRMPPCHPASVTSITMKGPQQQLLSVAGFSPSPPPPALQPRTSGAPTLPTTIFTASACRGALDLRDLLNPLSSGD